MDKRLLTETEIRSRYISPAIKKAVWDIDSVRQEFYYTASRTVVKGKKSFRKDRKFVKEYLGNDDD